MLRLLRALFAALLLIPASLYAQVPADATSFRIAAERYRASHEAAILGEFVDLLAIPNLASDRINIRRNADRLVASLQKRGVTARLLELEGVPPVVFGELRTPGATRTVVLYAHYDGQAVDLELRRSLGLAQTEAKDAPLAERIMLPALNVRGIQVGVIGEQAANVISTEAHASFDFRLVPNQTPERVRELVNGHIRAQGYFVTEDSVTMAMRLAHPKIARVSWGHGGYPASRAPMDLPFARAVLRAVGDGLGKPPILLPTMGGSIPAYLFEQVLHTPVIILPIANYDDNQHAANENLRMQNLWDGIDVYAGLMGRLGSYWTR